MKEKTIKIKKGENATIEIEGEIDAEILSRHYNRIFSEFQKTVEAPGFRKGHVPKEVAKKQINEKQLLEEAAYASLEEQYPIILETNDIDPITPPHIRITKLALGTPLSFQLSVGVKPEFSLPNYKKIAKEILHNKEIPKISEKEVDEVIAHIQSMRAPIKEGGDVTSQKTEELTDEFVKTLGSFENVSDFRKKIRENLEEEKKATLRREYREKIAQALVEKTKITLPPLLIEEELARILEKIEEQAKRNNLTKEAYFEKIKKSEETFKKEQASYIERQYKAKFILEKIADEEHIVPSQEEISDELAHLLQHYNDIDPENAERYVSEMIRNEKTLEFLENLEKENTKDI